MNLTDFYRKSSAYSSIRNFERNIEKNIKKILNFNRFKDGELKIKEYQNKFKGRCFIIGNGPSLTIKDLDTLNEHNEICIASNSIYNLFDKTNWRPNIYTIHDFQEIKKTHEKISALKPEIKIAAQSAAGKIYNINGAITIRLIEPDKNKEKISFSDDVSKCVYDGGTVTYVSIQCACYFGFKEIILLGVDHSFAREQRKDGSIEVNSKTKNHFEHYQTESFWGNGQKDEEAVVFPYDFATMAFEEAKKYSDKHSIKILNATRGGKLEVFERVNFDSLFKGEN